MRTIILTAAVLPVFLAASLAPLPTAVAQEAGRKRIAGTDVSLIPPRDFREAKNFTGFENPKVAASIMVSVLRGGIGPFIVGMTDERMKKKSMTVLSRQRMEIDRRQGLLLGISQDSGGVAYRKWMLVFGDSGRTALIVATFPKEREGTVSRLLKDALLTAKFGARGADFGNAREENSGAAPSGLAAEKLEGVPFRITPADPLKFAEVVQKVIMLTRTGRYPIADAGDPLFVAGKAAAAVASTDRKKFATERLAKTATLKEIEVEAVKEVTIDGLSGYEITAKAKHATTGRLLILYQVMLFTDDSYYLLQGMGLRNADPGFLEPFRKTAHSFRR